MRVVHYVLVSLSLLILIQIVEFEVVVLVALGYILVDLKIIEKKIKKP